MTIWARFPQPRNGRLQRAPGAQQTQLPVPCQSLGCVCWEEGDLLQELPKFIKILITNWPLFELGEGQEGKLPGLVCLGGFGDQIPLGCAGSSTSLPAPSSALSGVRVVPDNNF